MSAHGPGVNRTRVLQRLATERGQADNGTRLIGGGLPCHQAALLHARQVMREAAFRPVHRLSQLLLPQLAIPAEGAAIAIKLATLDVDGPTGGVFDDNKQLAW